MAPTQARDRDPAAAAIGALAQGRLRSSPYVALRDIGCTYREGVLTLRGSLPTHYLKQIALAAVADVAGVRTIVNRIEVVRGGPGPGRG